MQIKDLTQAQKIQSFKLATKIVLDIAEEIKSKSDLEQKQIVNKVSALLKELFPETVATSWYIRTYTGSKNQNDLYKLNEGEIEKTASF